MVLRNECLVTANGASCARSGQPGFGQFVLSWGLFMARQQSADGRIRLRDICLISRAPGQWKMTALASLLSLAMKEAYAEASNSQRAIRHAFTPHYSQPLRVGAGDWGGRWRVKVWSLQTPSSSRSANRTPFHWPPAAVWKRSLLALARIETIDYSWRDSGNDRIHSRPRSTKHMKRQTGTYEISTVAGEEIRAFLPAELPPSDPPLDLDALEAQSGQ